MKLVNRIFLQVFIAFLLLSQMILFYTLYQTQKESLKDVARYEEDAMTEKIRQFDMERWEFKLNLSLGQKIDKAEEVVVANVFRQIFGSRAALYGYEKELYNGTPYEFDYEGIAEEIKKKDSYFAEINNGEVMKIKLDGCCLILLNYEMYQRDGENSDVKWQIVWYQDVTDIYDRTMRLAVRGFLFTIAALLMVGGIFRAGLCRTMRPLQELKTAAADIASGNYDSRVPLHRNDEIGALAESFNDMAGQIREHIGQLSRTNDAQRQLLASLAHELKTPMTAIIGYSDTLLTVRISEERRRKALAYIGSECRRLSRLSAKMMELTGLYDTGESRVHMEAVQMEELLFQLQDLTAYRLQEKGLRLSVQCKKTERTMDRDLMLSLLLNLVDNACKASEPGNQIRIQADETGIMVEDYGTGIPKEELSRVTEAFYMVDKSRAKSEGSIGLGLALCQRIAKIHGAELLIESEMGKGTRVSVRWTEIPG